MRVIEFLKVSFCALAIMLAAMLMSSCGGGDNGGDNDFKWNLTEVYIPSTGYEAAKGGDISIQGKGFLNTDKVKMVGSTGDLSGVNHTIPAKSVTATSITITMPEALSSGRYDFYVVRDTRSKLLGTANVIINANFEDIPNQTGMDLKGYVYEGTKRLSGVVVSDGYTVTKTDSKGIYYLNKNAKAQFVFISIPGNYEALSINNIPTSFRRLNSAATGVQQFDFELTSTNNENHVVIAAADFHMGNRTSTNDIAQFKSGFVVDANATITKHSGAGKKVYILTLGDLTWDLYWYEDKFFTLPQYVTEMKAMSAPVFNCMGNHDNDMRATGSDIDVSAEQAYVNYVCPTYYSFNLGKVHYVVLDNMKYTNASNRDFSKEITADQLTWLKADLAMITDPTTPVVVAMHCQLSSVSVSGMGLSANPTLPNVTGANALMDCFNAFNNVKILTGHTHTAYTVDYRANITEHNIPAVSATWWWTGFYSNCHMATDGAPGGYGIFEFLGKEFKNYQYKGIGTPETKQFRTYDLNSVYITGDKFAPKASATNKMKLETEYASTYNVVSTDNQVLINVWNFGPGWNIEVKENGTSPLTVTRVSANDPLHIIAYEAQRLNVGQTPTSSFITKKTHHLFKVTATAANSPLTITVTDKYGNPAYTETMTRPKAFTLSMN